jgi:hypothetical protein
MSLRVIGTRMRPHQFVFKAIRRLYSNYERGRSYPVRQRVWNYQFATSDRQERVFLIVTAGDQVSNAAWTAASFLTQSKLLKEGFGLVFCLDSPANPPSDGQRLATSFPQARILTTTAVLSELRTEFPRLGRFADFHPLGRKLACLVAFGQQSDVLYSDSDILAFAQLSELENAINEKRCVYIGQSEESYDTIALRRIQAEGLAPSEPPLNSGLLSYSKGDLRGDLASRIVPDPEEMDSSSKTWWWTEQTVLSAVFSSMEAKVLPMDRYVVSLKRQLPFEEDVDYSRICVRHFVAPVRHLMYSKGIPRLLAKARRQWKLKDPVHGRV